MSASNTYGVLTIMSSAILILPMLFFEGLASKDAFDDVKDKATLLKVTLGDTLRHLQLRRAPLALERPNILPLGDRCCGLITDLDRVLLLQHLLFNICSSTYICLSPRYMHMPLKRCYVHADVTLLRTYATQSLLKQRRLCAHFVCFSSRRFSDAGFRTTCTTRWASGC